MPFEIWIFRTCQPVPDFNSQPDKDENDLFIGKTNICNKFQTNRKLLGGLAVLEQTFNKAILPLLMFC